MKKNLCIALVSFLFSIGCATSYKEGGLDANVIGSKAGVALVHEVGRQKKTVGDQKLVSTALYGAFHAQTQRHQEAMATIAIADKCVDGKRRTTLSRNNGGVGITWQAYGPAMADALAANGTPVPTGGIGGDYVSCDGDGVDRAKVDAHGRAIMALTEAILNKPAPAPQAAAPNTPAAGMVTDDDRSLIINNSTQKGGK